MSSGLTMRQQSAGMNVGAPTSARFWHSGVAAFSENGPTLAFVGGDREGEALGRACGMPDVISDQPRDG